MEKRKKWRGRLIALGVLLLIPVLIYLFRFPILRGAGNYLIKEDELSHAQVMFVLSGNSWDRGREAARLMEKDAANRVICTGGEVNYALQTLNIDLQNAEFTRLVMVQNGADSTKIDLLPEGTSTWEEFEAILAYSQTHNLKKVIVLSSKFHTRRIHQVFREPFEEEGIELIIRGAPESSFDEKVWWEQEQGLIFLNNEYVKMVYYWLKY